MMLVFVLYVRYKHETPTVVNIVVDYTSGIVIALSALQVLAYVVVHEFFASN